MCDRTIGGLAKLGQLTPEEVNLLRHMQKELKALPSGRWLWIGGEKWIETDVYLGTIQPFITPYPGGQ